jgi:hypothetical protein
MGERVDELVARLRKGGRKTSETLGSLDDDQWKMVLYEGPPVWTVRDLLAHFLSAEEGLLRIARDIAAGGPGAPKGFDYEAFNASEQARLAGLPPDRLLTDLAAAREATIAWVAGLEEADPPTSSEHRLDRMGRHPTLGKITLEAHINAIYGHQLLHMRDVQRLLG